jgi:rhamnopyranosyl-N-acetylglucosaminyl-diphospho-decaprenol beta-1,3/1,4-galactofuranosyltransferase
MQICAVTVAYNNPKEFTRLLRSLEGQLSLNGLIVIDNSCTSSIEDNAAAFRAYSQHYQFAHHMIIGKNIGSAAGFCFGMKMAHEKGFDWVWLLDQDGTVEKGCLESLLQNTGQADILCPKIVDIDSPHAVLPQSGATLNCWGRVVFLNSVTESRNISFFATHGALISRKALDRTGYYDPRYFFVGHEDFDYAFRATSSGMVVRLIAEAEARHPNLALSASKSSVHIAFGVIDSVSPEREITVAARLHPATKLRKRVSEHLPEELLWISKPLMNDKNCRTNRAIESLSDTYLATKRLTTLQLAAAIVYSLLHVLVLRIKFGGRINLKKTAKMYSICMLSKLRKKWPFKSVEEFCLYVRN